MKDLVFTPPSFPPSLLPAGTEPPPRTSQRSRKNDAPKRKNSRRQSFLRLSEIRTWSLKGSRKNTVISSMDSDIGREGKDRAPELKFLHAMDSHLRSVLNHKAYRLINKAQSYNGNTTARTGK